MTFCVGELRTPHATTTTTSPDEAPEKGGYDSACEGPSTLQTEGDPDLLLGPTEEKTRYYVARKRRRGKEVEHEPVPNHETVQAVLVGRPVPSLPQSVKIK